MHATAPDVILASGLDEAGMAATADLAAAIDYITTRGGQVRLVGDDK